MLVPEDIEAAPGLTDATAVYDLLTFHRQTGLRGVVNSWGVAAIPRLHDHLYPEALPIEQLTITPQSSEDGVDIGTLGRYPGTTVVLTSADDRALATAVTRHAAAWQAQQIPYHAFFYGGRVIFIARNPSAAATWDLEERELAGHYVSTFFFGGFVLYPRELLSQMSEERYWDLVRRLTCTAPVPPRGTTPRSWLLPLLSEDEEAGSFLSLPVPHLLS